MRAVTIKQFGDSSVFLTQDVPTPAVLPGTVLIRVAATSVNPVDIKIRNGIAKDIAPTFPAILHGDVAGVVAAVGKGVTTFKEGDEVYGCAGGVIGLQGALAEYMIADACLIALKPKNLPLVDAAALPLVTLTAWEGLLEKARDIKGRTLLVHASTGGVGHIAIQLGKWAGAEVYTTASSPEKQAIGVSLGAKDAINYRQESVYDYVNRLTHGNGFDVVFDTIGGDNLERSFEAAATYGEIIAIQSGGKSAYALNEMHKKSLSLHFVFMLLPMLSNQQRERHGTILRKVSELVEDGNLKPLIDQRRFTLENAGAAHDYLESGQPIGKVLIIL